MKKKLGFVLLLPIICFSSLCISCANEQDNINHKSESNFDGLSFIVKISDKAQYNGSTRAESLQKEDWGKGDTIYLSIDKNNDNVCYMVYNGSQEWSVKAYNNISTFANASGTLSAVYADSISYNPNSAYDAFTGGDVLYTSDGSYTKSGNLVCINLNMNQRPFSKIQVNGVDGSYVMDNCTEFVKLKSLYPVQWLSTTTDSVVNNKFVQNKDTLIFYGLVQADNNNNTTIQLKNKDGITYTRTYKGDVMAAGQFIGINGPLSDEASQWTCNIPVNGISIDESSFSMYEGNDTTLTATISPADATDKNITWSSSDMTVVSVNGNEVTAIKDGTATITATTEDGGYKASCVITVVSDDINYNPYNNDEQW